MDNPNLAWLAHVDKPFLLCLGCGLVTSFLLWHGKLDPANYTIVIMGTVGGYITGWATKQIKGTPTERAASNP